MNFETVDLLIHARWIIPVVPSEATFKNCAVAVREGRIIDICPSLEAERRYRPERSIHLDNHALIPGLVNAHGHGAMTLMRGYADDLDLDTWLNAHIWPLESRWVGEKFVRHGTELALAEMIASGTTCFADMYFFPDQVAAAARESGMRCQVAFPIIDFATAWAQSGEEYIHKGLALHDAYRDDDLINIAFGPHAPYSVADPLFEKIAIYANELDAQVQIHLHETRREVEDAQAKSGRKPIERLQQFGLLSPTTQCVHMTALDDDDIALLASSRAQVIHCPKSNMKLASGICPVTQLLANGINVALGTDGAASNNCLDLFAEMQVASLLAKVTSGDPKALNTHQALHMATLGGAKALGMEERIGSIEPGKAADLTAIDLGGIYQQPLYNPASQLTYTQCGAQVSHVWVNGRPLLDNRRLTTLHPEDIVARAKSWRDKIAN